MIWTKTGWWKTTYELWDGQRLVGRLQNNSGWKCSALADIDGAQIEFRKRKWWGCAYDAFSKQTDEPIATYDASAWKKAGTFRVGARTYRLIGSFLKSLTQVIDESGQVLFSMRNADWLGRKQEVSIEQVAVDNTDTYLLLFFTMFATIAYNDASESAVVAT